jgi:hypothetical protein
MSCWHVLQLSIIHLGLQIRQLGCVLSLIFAVQAHHQKCMDWPATYTVAYQGQSIYLTAQPHIWLWLVGWQRPCWTWGHPHTSTCCFIHFKRWDPSVHTDVAYATASGHGWHGCWGSGLGDAAFSAECMCSTSCRSRSCVAWLVGFCWTICVYVHNCSLLGCLFCIAWIQGQDCWQSSWKDMQAVQNSLCSDWPATCTVALQWQSTQAHS